MLPEQRPIFIVGVHRSGTSLLRYMLNSSPRIYIAPESDFIPRFFLGKPEQELDDGAIGSLLQTVFSEYNNYRSEWQGEPPQVSSFVEAGPTRLTRKRPIDSEIQNLLAHQDTWLCLMGILIAMHYKFDVFTHEIQRLIREPTPIISNAARFAFTHASKEISLQHVS